MDTRELRPAETSSTEYRVTLTLSVEDAHALWSAAAERAMRAPGMTLADVLDTIGPREDPSIAECIAMLAAPAPIAGCALDDYAVRPVREVLVAMPVRAVETDAPAAPAWKPGTASSALG